MVPSGGAGTYFLTLYLVLYPQYFGLFEIQVNGMQVCGAWGDNDNDDLGDSAHTSCNAVAQLQEGPRPFTHRNILPVVTGTHVLLQVKF